MSSASIPLKTPSPMPPIPGEISPWRWSGGYCFGLAGSCRKQRTSFRVWHVSAGFGWRGLSRKRCGGGEMSFKAVCNQRRVYDIPSVLIRRVINTSEPETCSRVCTASWLHSAVVQAEPRVLSKMIDGRGKEGTP